MAYISARMKFVIHHFHKGKTIYVGGPKQRNDSHVGVPNQSSGNRTVFLCKRVLLFSLKNMLIGHVSENALRTLACKNYSTHTQCGAGVFKGELD